MNAYEKFVLNSGSCMNTYTELCSQSCSIIMGSSSFLAILGALLAFRCLWGFFTLKFLRSLPWLPSSSLKMSTFLVSSSLYAFIEFCQLDLSRLENLELLEAIPLKLAFLVSKFTTQKYLKQYFRQLKGVYLRNFANLITQI